MQSHHKLFNLYSAIVLVSNLAFPGAVTASAWAGPTARLPKTSASLSALPSWFTAPAPSTAQHLHALPGWFESAIDSTAKSAIDTVAESAIDTAPDSAVDTAAMPAKEASTSALPVWFAPDTAQGAEPAVAAPDAAAANPSDNSSPATSALPTWFINQPPAGANPQPSAMHISDAFLTVDTFGPDVANIGAPIGSGELYTTIIRNSSVFTAYNWSLTTTYQSTYHWDNFWSLSDLTSAITNVTFVENSTAYSTEPRSLLTWTPNITRDLAPGQVLTLNFTLRADCNTVSDRRLSVGLRYTYPATDTVVNVNQGSLNMPAGHGTLVLTKLPSLQTIGTTQFGTPITWTVRVQNTGQGKLFGAVVTDTGGTGLAQPTGDLVPSASIPELEINETRDFTVTGLITSCKFINVAYAAWTCGNTAGDATFANPVSATAGILFQPELPKIAVTVGPSALAYSYCAVISDTVVVTITNSGGPAGNFVLATGFAANAFLGIDTSSTGSQWNYNSGNGNFAYLGGSPAGTLAAKSVTTLTFKVSPKVPICSAGSGNVSFGASYANVCNGDGFASSNLATLSYQYAQGEAPALAVAKTQSTSGLVRPGQIFTYNITVTVGNASNLGPVYVTDTLPSQLVSAGAPVVTTGTVNLVGQALTWNFPPGNGSSYVASLAYPVQVLTQTLCGASSNADNSVNVTATPTCPGCPNLTGHGSTRVIIVNNEGIDASGGTSGNAETCGGGFTLFSQYVITGSTIVTWTNAVFTDSMGTAGLGYGPLPAGASPLHYLSGTLMVTVNGVPYILTPTVISNGYLSLNLSPLQAMGVPTQNVTLNITFTADYTEGILYGGATGYSQAFYDWTQLYLPNVSSQGCATNRSFNQTRYLNVERGDLTIAIANGTVNQCHTSRVTLALTDNAPSGFKTTNTVITFTASTAQIVSVLGRPFTFTGSLAPYTGSITTTVITNTGSGRGIITFTLPSGVDLDGNGTILFDLDTSCAETPPWRAGISFQTNCGTTYTHAAPTGPGGYVKPILSLFVTPIEYTIDQREVVWWMQVSNLGNGPASRIVITNALSNLAVTDFEYSGAPGAQVSLSGTTPISDPIAIFYVTGLGAGESLLIAVTGTVIACHPLGVDITADLSCFGSTCSVKQDHVRYNEPTVYLESYNHQTAQLPLCDPGLVSFRTKNASPSAYLYNFTITETLAELNAEAGQSITLTIVRANGTLITSTTSFQPVTYNNGVSHTLVWAYNDPNAKGLLNALEPLATIIVSIPVKLNCNPGSPKAEAHATAYGPCNVLKQRDESAFTLPLAEPDMQLTKRAVNAHGDVGSNIAANPGDTITWQLSLLNNDNGRSYPARHVILTDTWPANFHFITTTLAFSPTIDEASRTITWTIGQVEVGRGFTFYITGTVENTACQLRTINYSRLYYGCDNGCIDGRAPMDSASLDSDPELEVVLNPLTLETCGGEIPITIRNYGAAAYTSTLVVTLPATYIYTGLVSYTPGHAPTRIITGATGTNPQFEWDLIPERSLGTSGGINNPTNAQINPEQFTLVLGVKNSGVSGYCPTSSGVVAASLSYNNQATCSQLNYSSTTDSASVTVARPQLQLTKTPAAQATSAGQTVTWTVTLANTGAGVANHVIVTDTAGGSFSEVTLISEGAGVTHTLAAGNTIEWYFVAPMAADDVWTATLSAVVNASGGSSQNQVTATAACDTGCQFVPVTDVAFTSLVDSFIKGPKIQTGTLGSQAVFTFGTFLPATDRSYDDLVFTDTLPAGLGYVSATVTYRFDSNSPQTAVAYTPSLINGNTLVWLMGNLSGSVQVSGIVTTVIQNTGSNQSGVGLTNRLTMTYSDTGQPYLFVDTARVNVVEPRLNLVKASQPSTSHTIGAGDAVTYTLTISNWSNTNASPAYHVLITDTLPPGMRDLAPVMLTATVDGTPANLSPQSFSSASGQWSLTLDTPNSIPVGGVLVIQYVTTATTVGAGLDLSNLAAVRWSSLPAGTPEARDYTPQTASTTLHTVLPKISKQVAPLTATLGSVISYVILVPSPLITAAINGAVVTDALDSRLQLQSVTSVDGGSVVSANNRFTVTYPATIAALEQRVITVTAVLSVGRGGAVGNAIPNVATLSHTTGITVSSQVVFTVTEPSLSIGKAVATSGASLSSVNGTARLTYTLTLTNWNNANASPAYSVLITDAIPAGISVTAQFGGDVQGGPVRGSATLTWVVNTIGRGSVTTLSYTAVISQALMNTALRNVVTSTYWSLTDTTPGAKLYPPISANKTITTADVSFSKLTNPSVLKVGDVVTYSLVFTVPAGEAGLGGSSYLTDVLPAGVIFIPNAYTLTNSPASVGVSPTVFVTGFSGISQVLTWTFGMPITSEQSLPTVVTLTLQAQATGVPITGATAVWWGQQATTATLSNVGGLLQSGRLITSAVPNSVIQPSLAFAKTALPPSGSPVGAGQTITYSLILTNNGQAPAYDLVITDALPVGIEYVATLSQTNPTTALVTPTVTGQLVTYAVSELAKGPNARMVITLVARLTDTISANLYLTNTAWLGYDSQPGLGPQTGLTPTQRVYTPLVDSAWHQTLVSLGNQVWFDVNDNGRIDTGEVGVPGVAVELYQDTNGDGIFTPGADAYLSTTTTIAGGFYTFTELLAGGYLVVITSTNFSGAGALVGYQNSDGWVGGNSDLNNQDHGVVSGTLGSGGFVASTVVSLTVGGEPTNDGDTNPNSNLTLDFGFYQLSLGNQVWLDRNHNGLLDVGETVVPGITVTLYNSTGSTVISTTTTNAGGFYTFTSLISGTYVVEIVPLPYFTNTVIISGSDSPDNNVDSDNNGVNWVNGAIRSNPVVLTPGDAGALGHTVVTTATGATANPTVDFGLYSLVSLGDQVWFDVNDNGRLDAGEVGVPGVAVELYQDTNGDGIFTPGADAYLSTTTTITNGFYLFDNLQPSFYPTQTYLVVVTSTNFSGAGTLVDYQNSDGWVGSNSDLNSQDHGVVSGTLGGSGFVASTAVSLTMNGEPVNDGDANPNSNLTLDFGFYRLSLGNQVWYDNNHNGWLDTGEAIVPSVTVRLYDSTGSNVISTTTTNAGGFYAFTNLISGTYVVEIVPPIGFTNTVIIGTSGNPGNNEDGDNNGVNWVSGAIRSNAVTLTPGDAGALGHTLVTTATGATANPTVDFGLYSLVSLGNQVWFDVNDNGLLDAGEVGVPGVAVELYQDTNGDGVFTPGTDGYLMATTTIAGGFYTFTNLLPSRYLTETYLVVITSTNFSGAGALVDYQNSDGSVGGNSDLNSQDHGVVSGTLGSGGYVASTPVSLTVGGEPVNDGDTNPNSNLTIDFGFYRLSLGNQVWYDNNHNGWLDTGETVVPSVTVRLYDSTGSTVISTTTTNAGGFYTFTSLISGTYVVEMVPPPYFTNTVIIGTSGNPDNNEDGDNNGVNWVSGAIRSNAVTLTPGDAGALGHTLVTTATGATANPTVDFGLYSLVSLGNQVWFDVNDNGRLDAGEVGVPGVAVELYQDTNGDGVFTPGADAYLTDTTTITNGFYLFDNLLPSLYPTQTYLVVITSTNFSGAGRLVDYQNSDGWVGGNSDLNSQDHGVVSGTLGSGGYVASTAVSLTVSGEPINDGDANPNSNLTLDFGFYRLSLGNQVWLDSNNNGLLDSATEAGIAGVPVRLYDGSGVTVISTTTTNAGGFYTFTNLISGTYVVEIVPPALYTSSTDIASSANPDNNQDSDDNGVNLIGSLIRSNPVTLTPGDAGALGNNSVVTATGSTANPTVDFGVFPVVSLGNQVWFDVNDNGLLDTGEVGVPGVAVELYQDTNGDGVFTPGADSYLTTTTTSAGGFYTFTNLLPSRYLTETYLVVITSTNFSGAGALVDYQNSDGSVGGNTDLNSQDHGVVFGTLGSGGYVASTPVSLTVGGEPVDDGDTNPSTNLTIDFGFYRLSLGNQVWYDNNHNGRLDTGEVVAAGILITLYDSTGLTVISTTTTNAGGFYTFTSLISGTYVVEIASPPYFTNTVVIGTSGNPGNNVDGDNNGVNWVSGAIRSNPITLTPGDAGALGHTLVTTATGATANPTVDFGLYSLVSLGNQVWFDVNDNGLLDAGEVGVPGVAVQLYQDTNGNGVFNPGVDTYLSATTTITNGFYLFDNLRPSLYPTQTYLVVITSTNFSGAGTLVDYRNSDGSVGGNSDLNSQDHGVVSGTLGSGGYVASTAVSLTVGGEPVNDGDTNPNSNLTLDFGFYRLSLGNQVWLDDNNNGLLDSGEVGLAGVTVRLYNSAGTTLLLTTTTDAAGFYTFTRLISGTYVVAILPPAIYTSSTDIASSANPDNNQDSDDNGVNLTGGLIRSNPVNLTPGYAGALGNTLVITATGSTANPTVDFGLYLPPNIALRKVRTSANPVRLSDPITFTVRLTNTGLTSLTVIPLIDSFDSVYLAFTSATPPPDITGTSQVQWNNVLAALGRANLLPGQSVSLTMVMLAVGITPPGAPAVNTATTSGVRDIHSQQPPTQTSIATVDIVPNLEVVKRVLGRQPYRVGYPLTFTIQITNLSNIAVLTLPVVDLYDPAYLGYLSATPSPSNTASGQIDWYDLGRLAPHATTVITVVFTAITETARTVNSAAVLGAVNSYGTPITMTTRVSIPTAVTLADFRVARQSESQVTLAWTTRMEVDNYGFAIYRAASYVDDPTRQAENVGFVDATSPGGADYTFTDNVPSSGVWWYWLVDVDTSGRQTVRASLQTGVSITADYRYHWYLPMVAR
jgi:uncharacterized repeat protein (TIGR01451 family)